MRRFGLPALILVALLAMISAASGYEVPPLDDSSWDIALFLSPYGIVSNLIAGNALSTFYDDPGRGREIMGAGRWLFALGYCGLAALFYWLGRRARQVK